jgi:hypothetical protein
MRETKTILHLRPLGTRAPELQTVGPELNEFGELRGQAAAIASSAVLFTEGRRIPAAFIGFS